MKKIYKEKYYKVKFYSKGNKLMATSFLWKSVAEPTPFNSWGALLNAISIHNFDKATANKHEARACKEIEEKTVKIIIEKL